MDICTIPFNCNDPTAYYSAPNKLWEYLALEKPVITTPIPDAIIQARNFVDIATTSNDYQKIIKDYIRAPEKFQEKAKNAKQFVRKKTWTNMAERYEHLLASI
jgi:spore maturation protein CgeB